MAAVPPLHTVEAVPAFAVGDADTFTITVSELLQPVVVIVVVKI
jgi:hypothetical protein